MSPMHLAPCGAPANNQFALDLYADLCKPGANVFISPFSIGAALAMLHAGARGETARQIETVLHLPKGEALRPARLENASGRPVNAFMRIANAAWADAEYPIRPEYLERLQREFDAELRSVDFVHDGEPTRRIINDWVRRKTQGRIQMLLAEPLDERTRLILTNVVYFLAKWSKPFEIGQTRPEPFFFRPDRSIEVPMMHERRFMSAVANDTYHAAQLYYEDGPSMWVLAPARRETSLEEMEASLGDWSRLDDELRQAKRRQVILSMPRFQLRSKFELSKHLARLGMGSSFSDDADFTGMHLSHPEPLQLSAVIHETFIDVNEHHTEATAATAMLVAAGGAGPSEPPPPPLELRLDRPFMYIIRDTMPGAILFIGRVANPSGEHE